MDVKPIVQTTGHAFTFSDAEAAQMYWDLKWVFEYLESQRMTFPQNFSLYEFYLRINQIKIERIKAYGKWG